MEEFLKSIATLTQAESERKAARKIDYDKAQRSNASFERNEIGWKPTLFVKPGIASDSKEFADAIFDIQQMLGIKADGMAGPIDDQGVLRAQQAAEGRGLRECRRRQSSVQKHGRGAQADQRDSREAV